MKLPTQTFAAALLFAAIPPGYLALMLLVILMARFPPLLVAVLLACWLFSQLQKSER